MAPFVVDGYGDSAWEPYTGTDSARRIDLAGSGVAHGDLIVVFAYSYTTILGAGDDFGPLSVGQGGIGSAISNGPSNNPGALAANTVTYPFEPIGHADESWSHIGSCVWNSAGSTILSAGFVSPPTGLVGEPGFVNVAIIRDANSGNVLPITDPQTLEEFTFDNKIPFEAGGSFGHADGLWINFLNYVGVRDVPGAGADTSADFVLLDITDQGQLDYIEDVPANLDYAIFDASAGSLIDTSQFLYTMIDEGVSLNSPAGDWIINPDLSNGTDTIQRCFFGGSLSVQVWFDPDFNPEFPDEDTPGTTQVTPLHIPHKYYAHGQTPLALTPLAQHQYFTNLKFIESWADGLRCSGTVEGGGGEGSTTTYTPTDGKWKERQLHIPHKETLTSRHVRENYLAIERWANAICPPLHIPHKDWVLMGNSHQEQVNLLTIERWARDIGRCCEGIVDDGGPEG